MGFQHWSYCYCGDNIRLLDRLKEKKRKMQDQMERGRKVTEQMKAEKLRKKTNKRINMKPGARQAIVHGMTMKKSPMDVMREEYERRRYEREQKKKKKTSK